MKEPKAIGQFQRAVEDLRLKQETKILLKHLDAIRDAVTELQAEGVALSLEVRPGAYKCPLGYDSRAGIIANGVIHVGAVDIDFVILSGSGSMRFAAHLGAVQVEQKDLSNSYATELKETVTNVILSVGAQGALLDEFNIDEGGRPGISTAKSIAVSKPLKLKDVPKP